MTSPEDQARKDGEIEAAIKAYDSHDRGMPFEEVRAVWERMWEALDFSWEGLADAGWERSQPNSAQRFKRWQAPIDFPSNGKIYGEGEAGWKEATLQDYWRWSLSDQGQVLLDDAALLAMGLLSEIDGRLWHALHRPGARAEVAQSVPNSSAASHRSESDQFADQTAEVALGSAVIARLTTAGPLGEADRRIQLAGARADGLDACARAYGESIRAGDASAVPVIHISAPVTAFRTLDAQHLIFGDDAQFSWSLLGTRIRFDRATFGEKAEFTFATFGERARFDRAVFGIAAKFYGASFGDFAWFSGATFGEQTWFAETTFGEHAYFGRATFGDGARFDNAAFESGPDAHEATFGEAAWFGGAAFGDKVGFHRATFGDKSYFGSCIFGVEAGFDGAVFGNWVVFTKSTFGRGAKFVRTTFGRDTIFQGVAFGDEIAFNNATFGNNTYFDQAKFGCDTSFRDTIFSGPVWFHRALFSNGATFDRVSFNGTVSFRAADFDGYATFQNAAWPQSAEDQQAAFEGCRFRDVADFMTADLAAFALFDGAELQSRLLLAEPVKGQTSADDLFFCAIAATERAVLADATTSPPNFEPHRKERGADARFGALAGGLRTLRKAMAHQGDVMREHRFYRYELMARARRPSEPALAKGATWIYGLVSDYGAAIGRPLVTLVALMGLFGLIYWGMAFALAFPWQIKHLPNGFGRTPMLDAWEALNFSWNNTFRPLSALSAEVIGPKEPSWASHLLYGFGPGWGWAVRLVATLQSLCAIVLAFLLALAVRRRFQIT